MFQCKNINGPTTKIKQPSRLDLIKESGVLKVVTDYNSTSYFIYKGQPMGYQYELLQNLADHMGVKLEVSANNNLKEKFDLLNDQQVDLIAVNLTVTKERRNTLEFTVPHTQTRQVLIQRKPESWKQLSEQSVTDELLANQLELARKKIHVQQNSVYAKRLRNLSDEIGDSISIVETEEGVEELIQQVAEGKIDYTVCDENVAMVNQTYYDNIDISLPVSFPQNLAWAVKKGDDELKDAIDVWLTNFKNTRKYAVIYNKYFKNKRTATLVESDYFANSSGTISPYDDIIKTYSTDIDWDWRLVASMVYQESRFNPNAKSWAGAFGLMQLMPVTANRFGVDSASPVQMQIRAGVMFIQWLDRLYEDITDPAERQKFVLASYNVGPGHVMDAMKLAEKYGKNPNVWTNNVDDFLLKKSIPKYYNDTIVKYGYCRGSETYNYVIEVVERFEHYKNLVN